MSTKHTPGPWGLNREQQVISTPDRYNSPPLIIATVNQEGELRQYAQANAYLIAAAPEMLEALNKLTEAIHLNFRAKDVIPHYVRAIAAIKKAEGGS